MITSTLLVCLCLFTRPIPTTLYLKNGTSLPNDAPISLHRGLVHLQRGAYTFTLPATRFDLMRSLRPPPPPKPVVNPRDRHRIPWEHPAFRRKTKSNRAIVLTTEGLAAYRQGRKTEAGATDAAEPTHADPAKPRAAPLPDDPARTGSVQNPTPGTAGSATPAPHRTPNR